MRHCRRQLAYTTARLVLTAWRAESLRSLRRRNASPAASEPDGTSEASAFPQGAWLGQPYSPLRLGAPGGSDSESCASDDDAADEHTPRCCGEYIPYDANGECAECAAPASPMTTWLRRAAIIEPQQADAIAQSLASKLESTASFFAGRARRWALENALLAGRGWAERDRLARTLARWAAA